MMTEERKPLSARAFAAVVGGLMLLHLILAILYANVTPYRTPGYLFVTKSHLFDPAGKPYFPVPDIGAPDERQHANYVLEILSGAGLPVYQVNVPDPLHPGQLMRNPLLDEVYEFHQAPLYYGLDAAFGRLTGVDEFTGEDSQGGVRLRYLNALFGALTVLGVYFLSVWGFQRRDVGVLAAAIAALLPMNVALSGAISNDPLLFALCTWTLAICARCVRDGWTRKRALAVGILVGLAILTKATALILFPVVGVAFLLKRPKPIKAAICVASALLLAIPWWIRNQQIYGDPLGLKAFQELFAAAPKAGDLMSYFGPFGYWINFVGWWTARSFFGVFGYMDIFLNERGYADSEGPNALYRLLLVLAIVACVGFLQNLRRGVPSEDRRVHWLNAAMFGLVTLMFLRYNYSFFQGQARYFFPALGPICVGLAMGALYLGRRRKRMVFVFIFGGLVMLNVYALSRLPAEFARRTTPPQLNLTSR